MSRDPQQASDLFTQIDITADPQSDAPYRSQERDGQQTQLLHQILAALDRNNELLEELVTSTTATQRQRSRELRRWRQANPALADACRSAAEGLSQVQTEFLRNLTEEIEENGEAMQDGEFVFNEFVDRFGPRLAHLNGVLQMLSQLSHTPRADDE